MSKHEIKDIAKKIAYTGIGAIAVAAEAAGGVVEKLAEKGEKVATDSKVINEGKKAVKDFKENVSKSKAKKVMDAVVENKGGDVFLKVGANTLKLPISKLAKFKDGSFNGKTVVLGIRPEDMHDSELFINSSPDSVIESDIKVYELLGAEVFLYFDVEGFQMTARVNPRTNLRTGDHAKFALDMEKVHIFDKETELTITN